LCVCVGQGEKGWRTLFLNVMMLGMLKEYQPVTAAFHEATSKK